MPLLIDEFQRAPDLGLEIKAILDEMDERGLVWLTGSQKLGLRKAVAEALSGRVASFELFPFSLYELQGKGPEQKPFMPTGELTRGSLDPLTAEELWKIIWQGSWPEVVHDEPDQRDAFFDSLLRTYIEKDILSTGVRRVEDFERFLSVLASRIGQEFAIGEIQKAVGVAAETVRDWLNVAVATGVVYLLPPFYENAYNAGAFFENFVVMEIVKSWKHNGKKPLFYFYRDTRQNEIDLLIREGDIYYPIEIKSTASPQRKMLDNFGVLKGDTIKRGPGALICTCDEPCYLTSDVVALPVWAL